MIFGFLGIETRSDRKTLIAQQQLRHLPLTRLNLYFCIFRYLEESLLNLEVNHPATREHGASIIKNLLKQLEEFLQQQRQHAMTRQVKMLLMAAKSLHL